MKSKICSVCDLEKTAEYFYTSVQTKDRLNTSCKECDKERTKKWRAENLDRARAAVKSWSARNKERVAVLGRRYWERNAERLRPIYAERTAKYKFENKEKCNQKAAEKYSKKICSQPKWANKFFIQEIYHLSQLRSKVTGIKWHVDHIVPLSSKIVCGLHVENNLRVIPALLNIRKGNRAWPDMP